MRPFAFFVAICAIAISANASSFTKRQLNSSPELCKNTLKQGLSESKQAIEMIKEANLKSFTSADVVHTQVSIVIRNLKLTSQYCCKSSEVDVSAKGSEKIMTAIEIIFHEYFIIRSYIRQGTKDLVEREERNVLIRSLFKDCANNFKKDPRHNVGGDDYNDEKELLEDNW